MCLKKTCWVILNYTYVNLQTLDLFSMSTLQMKSSFHCESISNSPGHILVFILCIRSLPSSSSILPSLHPRDISIFYYCLSLVDTFVSDFIWAVFPSVLKINFLSIMSSSLQKMTTKLSILLPFIFLRKGLVVLPRLAYNSWPSCSESWLLWWQVWTSLIRRPNYILPQ